MCTGAAIFLEIGLTAASGTPVRLEIWPTKAGIMVTHSRKAISTIQTRMSMIRTPRRSSTLILRQPKVDVPRLVRTKICILLLHVRADKPHVAIEARADKRVDALLTWAA